MSRLDFEVHATITLISIITMIAIGAIYYHMLEIPINGDSLYWVVGAAFCIAISAIALKYRYSPRKTMMLLAIGVMVYTGLDYSVVDSYILGGSFLSGVFTTTFLVQSAFVFLGYGCIIGYYWGNRQYIPRLFVVNLGIIICQILTMLNEIYVVENPEIAYALLLITLPDIIMRVLFMQLMLRSEYLGKAERRFQSFRLTREFHLLLVCIIIAALLVSEQDYLFYELMGMHTLFGDAWIKLTGAVICWLCIIGAVYFRTKKRISVTLASIGVSVYTALSYVIQLDIEGDIWSIVFLFQSVYMNVLVLLSFGCIIGYFLGYIHNVTRLLLINVGIIALKLMPWYIERYIYHDLEIANWVLASLLPSILIIVAYLSYLIRPDIIDMSISNQLKMRLARVESTMIMSNMAYMEREEMDVLLNPEDPRWKTKEDGPVEKECLVTILGPTKRKYYLTARVWRGEDYTRVVMSPEKNSRGSWGMDFDIVSHRFYEIEGKEIVRIYGHDGLFVDIYTENPRIHKENKISDALDRIIREY